MLRTHQEQAEPAQSRGKGGEDRQSDRQLRADVRMRASLGRSELPNLPQTPAPGLCAGASYSEGPSPAAHPESLDLMLRPLLFFSIGLAAPRLCDVRLCEKPARAGDRREDADEPACPGL